LDVLVCEVVNTCRPAKWPHNIPSSLQRSQSSQTVSACHPTSRKSPIATRANGRCARGCSQSASRSQCWSQVARPTPSQTAPHLHPLRPRRLRPRRTERCARPPPQRFIRAVDCIVINHFQPVFEFCWALEPNRALKGAGPGGPGAEGAGPCGPGRTRQRRPRPRRTARCTRPPPRRAQRGSYSCNQMHITAYYQPFIHITCISRPHFVWWRAEY
jgi:hypothetical protein